MLDQKPAYLPDACELGSRSPTVFPLQLELDLALFVGLRRITDAASRCLDPRR
jgi:hypothetical protein